MSSFVTVTIPGLEHPRRFVSPDKAHMEATLSKPCYGDPNTRTVTVQDITQQERQEVADRLLDNYTHVELRNITPAGAIRFAQWVGMGNAKAIAVEAWIDAHWTEFRAKTEAVMRGEAVNLMPTSLWKPYSYAEIAADISSVA